MEQLKKLEIVLRRVGKNNPGIKTILRVKEIERVENKMFNINYISRMPHFTKYLTNGF